MISDVESTTPVREGSGILRYDNWIFEDAQDPVSWLLGGGDAESDDDEEDELALACRFAGHTFALYGDQSIADIATDIAFLVQDDVTDEIWGAWSVCPVHQHPMSPRIIEEKAMWTCPADADVAVPIGRLGHGSVSPRFLALVFAAPVVRTSWSSAERAFRPEIGARAFGCQDRGVSQSRLLGHSRLVTERPVRVAQGRPPPASRPLNYVLTRGARRHGFLRAR